MKKWHRVTKLQQRGFKLVSAGTKLGDELPSKEMKAIWLLQNFKLAFVDTKLGENLKNRSERVMTPQRSSRQAFADTLHDAMPIKEEIL